ncbi:MAG: hypothetical protein OET44_01350 [Gammaproteobacteria bacterium]|nr:hypothetical protein [Gammaproteobacteria bacterium]
MESAVVIFARVALMSVTLSAAGFAFGQDAAAPDPTVDAMERQLETGRHERLISRIAEDGTFITGFTTDGCSGGLSAGWEYLSGRFPDFAARHGTRPPWEDCCVAHDRVYHSGGVDVADASESFEQRKAADLELMSCVVATGVRRSAELQSEYQLTESQVALLYEAIAGLMYRSVRLGGVPCTVHPWRWGYGWPECR